MFFYYPNKMLPKVIINDRKKKKVSVTVHIVRTNSFRS